MISLRWAVIPPTTSCTPQQEKASAKMQSFFSVCLASDIGAMFGVVGPLAHVLAEQSRLRFRRKRVLVCEGLLHHCEPPVDGILLRVAQAVRDKGQQRRVGAKGPGWHLLQMCVSEAGAS